MSDLVRIEDLQAARRQRVLLDVRSPGEYEKGHVPGAYSFPLFSDEERAAVGTLYKHGGPEKALQLGLQFVGPKMAGFVGQAGLLAPERRLVIHCWRGGNRSQSMAWLLRMAGFEVLTLEGGYKAYRRQVLDYFERQPLRLEIIGGRTGSGKTKILHALHDAGEQIIDLEGLACHKGSAFGSIGESPQPSTEQFENNLFEEILRKDPEKRIWIENESRSIGKVFIPEGLWNRMQVSPVVFIEIPDADRMRNLLQDYVQTDPSELSNAFLKIDKKLGGLNLKTALKALENGDYAKAAEIALGYYDKTYQFGMDHNSSPKIRNFVFDSGDPVQIAHFLSALPCTTTI